MTKAVDVIAGNITVAAQKPQVIVSNYGAPGPAGVATPGGLNGSVQYNNNGVLGGFGNYNNSTSFLNLGVIDAGLKSLSINETADISSGAAPLRVAKKTIGLVIAPYSTVWGCGNETIPVGSFQIGNVINYELYTGQTIGGVLTWTASPLTYTVTAAYANSSVEIDPNPVGNAVEIIKFRRRVNGGAWSAMNVSNPSHNVWNPPSLTDTGSGWVDSTVVTPTDGASYTHAADFVGAVQADSVILTVGAGANKVLTSDAGGNASWSALTTANISDSTDKRYVTDAGLGILGATSGTNTGDETNSTILSKLGIASISGVNTGDETLSTIKTKLGIATLSGSNTGDQNLTGLCPYTGASSNLNLAAKDLLTSTGRLGIANSGNFSTNTKVNIGNPASWSFNPGSTGIVVTGNQTPPTYEDRLAFYGDLNSYERTEIAIGNGGDLGGWQNNFMSFMVHGNNYPYNYYLTNGPQFSNAGMCMLVAQGSLVNSLGILTTTNAPIYFGTNNLIGVTIGGDNSVTIPGTTNLSNVNIKGGTTVIGSGGILGLGSDAYILATGSMGENAGFTASRDDLSMGVGFDLLNQANGSTGWSMSMIGMSSDLQIVDRAASTTRLYLKAGGGVGVGMYPVFPLDILGNVRTSGYYLGNGSTLTSSVSTKTSNYNALGTDKVIRCNGTFTVTLPSSTTSTGITLFIKNIGTGTITIAGNGSDLIDGQSTVISSNQYDCVQVVCNGSGWDVL